MNNRLHWSLFLVAMTIADVSVAETPPSAYLFTAVPWSWGRISGWTGNWSFASDGTVYKASHPIVMDGPNPDGVDETVAVLIDRCHALSDIKDNKVWKHSRTLVAQQGVPLRMEVSATNLSRVYRSWWFGDDRMIVRSPLNTREVTHVYNQLGNFEVFLLAWNDTSTAKSIGFHYTNGAPYLYCADLDVQVVPNTAPTVAPSATSYEQYSGDYFVFTANGSDVDGNALTYQWLFSDGSAMTGSTVMKAWGNLGETPRTEWAKVTVSDGGAAVSAAVTVTVLPRSSECGRLGCN